MTSREDWHELAHIIKSNESINRRIVQKFLSVFRDPCDMAFDWQVDVAFTVFSTMETFEKEINSVVE